MVLDLPAWNRNSGKDNQWEPVISRTLQEDQLNYIVLLLLQANNLYV